MRGSWTSADIPDQDGSAAESEEDAARLWAVSEKRTGVTYEAIG